MFRGNCTRLAFLPADGMKVLAKGYISVFERDGQYQLYCERIDPDGVGTLFAAYEKLRKQLETEGLFDEKHKKPLPFLPQRIGVVTSETGAVIRDIINIVMRRFPAVEIKLFPVSVQGMQAPAEIAAAIWLINEYKCADVIIVARGGGSLEELWAFNEEIVARAIFESEIPVISAVGHETDFTIADFVADLRAPTPSAAAELVVPEMRALIGAMDALRQRLMNVLKGITVKYRLELESIKNSPVFTKPLDRVMQGRMSVDLYMRILNKNMKIGLMSFRKMADRNIMKFEALNPGKIIERGYCIAVKSVDGNVIKSVKDVMPEEGIILKVADGDISCNVTGITAEETPEDNKTYRFCHLV